MSALFFIFISISRRYGKRSVRENVFSLSLICLNIKPQKRVYLCKRIMMLLPLTQLTHARYTYCQTTLFTEPSSPSHPPFA